VSSGLYSGVSGLALGSGLYRNVSGLWGGASGLINGFGGGGPFPGASLYLDFLTPPLDSRITFSRGTNATLVDSTGKITYAPANLLLQSGDPSNAAWGTKTNISIASGAADPDGGTGAYTVTATAANGRLLQAAAVGAFTPCLGSIWIRRRTGTGVIRWEAANVGAGAVIPVTSTWQRFSVAEIPASATYYFGIRIDTSGDAVDIAFGQLEPVTYQTTPSPYVATTASAFYGPRFDYDPVTLAPRGLLIEEARTNLLTYSAEFDNAIWGKSNATVAANVTASPDGTTNADTITEDSATSTHGVSQISGSTATGAFSFSVFVKANGRSGVNLFLRNGGGGNIAEAFFNLSAATATVSGMLLQTGWSAASAAIQVLANGWYRCVISATADGTLTQAKTGFIRLNNGTGSNPSYAGNGTSGIFAWGADLEAGAFATSYIPTVASTVSRSADVATMTGTNFSTWWNATQGTFVVDADTVQASGNRMIEASAGSLSRVVDIYAAGGPVVQMYNGTTAYSTSNNFTLGSPIKVAGAYQTANYAVVLNGGTVRTDAAVLVNTADSLQIGRFSGASNYLNGHIRAIAYYNTRLPNTQLQTLTAPSLASPLALDFISPTYTVGY
jgi:hypothetical protein